MSAPDLPGPGAPEHGIVVEGLTKRYGSGEDSRTALEDVSLRIARGSFTSVVGPSGSGKSTLLRIVAGLLGADEGSVSLFGEAIAEARANQHIGYVPQHPALLAWRSVVGNVELPFQVNRHGRRSDPSRRRETRSRAMAALSMVGLADVAGRRPAELSGGMQQRVALARALVFDPPVLLMDEPFSALDELTRYQLRVELSQLVEGSDKTVLFVTHSIAEAVLLSDTVVVLSSGPGRVAGTVDVTVERPRSEATESTPEFHALEDEVRRVMRESWKRAGS